MARTIETAHLENHGTRSIFGMTFILKPQPKCVRPQFWKGSHHRDVANRGLAERAGSTERFGEVLGVSHVRQGVCGHINLNGHRSFDRILPSTCSALMSH